MGFHFLPRLEIPSFTSHSKNRCVWGGAENYTKEWVSCLLFEDNISTMTTTYFNPS